MIAVPSIVMIFLICMMTASASLIVRKRWMKWVAIALASAEFIMAASLWVLVLTL